MPQKIEVKLLYPEEFESFTPSVLASLKAHVLPKMEVLPKKQPKSGAQPKRCPRLGVVCWGGKLDEAGWPNSLVEQTRLLNAAKKMDALAIWFDRGTLMPPTLQGERKSLAEELWTTDGFADLIDGLKQFVQGVEITLVRRVIVLGTSIDNQVERELDVVPKWIDVPKDRKPREITREELLAALGVTPEQITDIRDTSPERIP